MTPRYQPSREDIPNVLPSTPVFRDYGHREKTEALSTSLFEQLDGHDDLSAPFRRMEMVRLMHLFSRTQQSKDLLLQS